MYQNPNWYGCINSAIIIKAKKPTKLYSAGIVIGWLNSFKDKYGKTKTIENKKIWLIRAANTGMGEKRNHEICENKSILIKIESKAFSLAILFK